MELLITTIFLCITTAVIITLEVIKTLTYNKPTFIDIICIVTLLIVSLVKLPKDNIGLCVLYSVLSLVILSMSIVSFVFIVRAHNAYKRKLTKYLKDSEYDFYLQVDKKSKIIDYGISLLKTTGLLKNDVLNKNCWKLLADAFEIISINKMEATKTNMNAFIEEYEEAISKFKTYNFEINLIIKEKPITYKGIIEPIYLNSTLLGRNIYFYLDRMKNIEALQNELQNAIYDIERLKNQNYAMMSLYDGAILYFDFETKMYVATESFCRFTNTHQKEYTFTELVDYIHPDDLDGYIEQSETINSISVTRLKFRLLINDTYYSVMEDSIYLNGDNDLISIIRVIEAVDDDSKEKSFSTKEAIKIVESLNDTNITQIVEKTQNILTTITTGSAEKTNEEPKN